jgi:hypothetical protein
MVLGEQMTSENVHEAQEMPVSITDYVNDKPLDGHWLIVLHALDAGFEIPDHLIRWSGCPANREAHNTAVVFRVMCQRERMDGVSIWENEDIRWVYDVREAAEQYLATQEIVVIFAVHDDDCECDKCLEDYLADMDDGAECMSYLPVM